MCNLTQSLSLFESENTLSLLWLLLPLMFAWLVKLIWIWKASSFRVTFDLTNSFCYCLSNIQRVWQRMYIDENGGIELVGKGWCVCVHFPICKDREKININVNALWCDDILYQIITMRKCFLYFRWFQRPFEIILCSARDACSTQSHLYLYLCVVYMKEMKSKPILCLLQFQVYFSFVCCFFVWIEENKWWTLRIHIVLCLK